MRAVYCTLLFAAATVVTCGQSWAAVLYESGALGPTGVAYGTTDGTNITPNVYAGVRFELTQPVITSQVGGHFVAFTGGTFFGAIVKLSGPNDLPDSGNLSTADVLGTTSLTFPALSAEAYGDLLLPLSPGWYALVFGSGLFGTSGSGGGVANGVDIDLPTYIGHQPGGSPGWGELSSSFANFRFVTRGNLVSEPSSCVLPTILLILFRRDWRLYFRRRTS